MALVVRHKFVSQKADTADPSLIRPSNWNDTHEFTAAARRLIGRPDQTDGAVREVTLGTGLDWSGSTIINTLDISGKYDKAGGILTGDLTVQKEAPSLWLHFPSVKRARWFIAGDGSAVWQDQSGQNHFRIYADGSVWTQQFGDLNNRINAVAAAAANPCVTQLRWINSGNLTVTVGWTPNSTPSRPFWSASTVTPGGGQSPWINGWQISALQAFAPNRGWFTIEVA